MTRIRVGESIVLASLPEGLYVASIVDGTHITASGQAAATSTETVTIGGEGLRIDVVGGLQDSNDSRELTVRFHGMSQSGLANSTGPMLMLGGSGVTGSGSGNMHYGNTCISSLDVWVCHNNGVGVAINNSDHLVFTKMVMFPVGSGNDSGICATVGSIRIMGAADITASAISLVPDR